MSKFLRNTKECSFVLTECKGPIEQSSGKSLLVRISQVELCKDSSLCIDAPDLRFLMLQFRLLIVRSE